MQTVFLAVPFNALGARVPKMKRVNLIQQTQSCHKRIAMWAFNCFFFTLLSLCLFLPSSLLPEPHSSGHGPAGLLQPGQPEGNHRLRGGGLQGHHTGQHRPLPGHQGPDAADSPQRSVWGFEVEASNEGKNWLQISKLNDKTARNETHDFAVSLLYPKVVFMLRPKSLCRLEF